MRRSFSICTLAGILLAGLAPLSFAEEDPTPHAVIDRALKAGGGADKIKQFKAVTFKADLVVCKEEKYKASGTIAGPTLFRLEWSDDLGKRLIVCNGGNAWVRETARMQFELPLAQLVEKELQAVATTFFAVSLPDRLLSLKDRDCVLTTAGECVVNGLAAVALRVKHASHVETMIYFDKVSGLPIKTQLNMPGSKEGASHRFEGEQVEVFFDEYKEFEGVRHFTRLKMRCGEWSVEAELHDLQLHRTIDAGTFKKPG